MKKTASEIKVGETVLCVTRIFADEPFTVEEITEIDGMLEIAGEDCSIRVYPTSLVQVA